MKVEPLQNETKPHPPIRWEKPEGCFPHKVEDGETWATVARRFDVKSAQYLIWVNFRVFVDAKHPGSTNEVNWYLREYVGCNVSTDGGRNWAFSNSADPGVIYIPTNVWDFEGDGLVITGSTGVGSKITVPQYDDHNFLLTLSKALDIYSVADMGIGVSEVALPALAEAGLVVIGPVVSLLSLAVSGAVAHSEALRFLSRQYFFEGFSVGLVMSANGASENYILTRHELKYPPLNAQYKEKTKTFQNLHNMGLRLGIKQGAKFNTVDTKNFFVYLHSQLSARDMEYFTLKVPFKDWSEAKKKEYYQILSSLVKQEMIDNNLKLNIR